MVEHGLDPPALGSLLSAHTHTISTFLLSIISATSSPYSHCLIPALLSLSLPSNMPSPSSFSTSTISICTLLANNTRGSHCQNGPKPVQCVNLILDDVQRFYARCPSWCNLSHLSRLDTSSRSTLACAPTRRHLVWLHAVYTLHDWRMEKKKVWRKHREKQKSLQQQILIECSELTHP